MDTKTLGKSSSEKRSELDDLFYNPKSGFVSANKLIKKANLLGLKNKELVDFYKAQEINQTYQGPKNKIYHKITVPEVGYLQMDSIDMSSNPDAGYCWILTLIDVSSCAGVPSLSFAVL